jgi:small-conductance mechanosensitive channel
MDLAQTVEVFLLFTIRQAIPGIIGSLASILIGSYFLGIIVRVSTAAARRARVKPALVDLMGASLTGAGWILIAASVLQSLGLNQIAFAVGGSISLVALGIAGAASGNLADIIAGVFLASDPDFGTGFTVKSGDLIGVIERIDLRKTRVRGPDGKLHVIPNKDIESKIWIVEQRPPLPTPLIQRPKRKADGEPHEPNA